LDSPAAYSVFERERETIRRQYGFVVAGYVLMPEHVHPLVGEALVSSLSVALQVLKQKTSCKLKRKGDARFWQRRYYDFNVHSELKRVEKPEDWPWSSFVHYATGTTGLWRSSRHGQRRDGKQTRCW
jgi:putative transposase